MQPTHTSRRRHVRLRWLTGGWGGGHHLVLWLNIGGHKPLAHLPRWRRRLLHLPAVRWRLWPRPWNFNGPVVGWRAQSARDRTLISDLYWLASEHGLHNDAEALLHRRRAAA